MTETVTGREARPTETPSTAGSSRQEPTGWVGWIAFAATMMMIAGILQMFYGFVAVVNDEWVVWGNRANLYLDLTQWGWVHMIGGLIVLLAGIGLLRGNIVSRTIAVIVASLGLIANFMFIPAYPVWALTLVTLNALVIWAVTAHGREVIDLR